MSINERQPPEITFKYLIFKGNFIFRLWNTDLECYVVLDQILGGIMKIKLVSCLLASLFLFSSCDIPENYKLLLTKDAPVGQYKTFAELTSITPIPCRMELGIWDVLVLIFQKIFTTPTLSYSCIKAQDSEPIEKKVGDFFGKTSLKNTLRLVGYARQLGAGHSYRINPLLPFFTNAGTNSLFANLEVGPASLAPGNMNPTGYVASEITFLASAQTPETVTFDMPITVFPRAGVVLLFDHSLFTLDSLLQENEKNILSDVIIHELTHVWHQELYTEKNMSRIHVLMNQSNNGHDVPNVTNPTMALFEGLAIAAEALYGSVTSQMVNMSAREREVFYGNTNSVEDELSFLINRQIYVRKNSFLYNLYDYQGCKLRDPNKSLAEEENFDMPVTQNWIKERFYSITGLVDSDFIAANCPMTTPARLASNEGFISTLFYHLLASGSLVSQVQDEQKSFFPSTQPTLAGFIKTEIKRNYDSFLNRLDENQVMLKSDTDPIAAARLQTDIKNFLFGFRELVNAIKTSQPTTAHELLTSLLTSNQLSSFTKKKLVYEILKISRGQLSSNPSLRELFSDPLALTNRTAELASAVEIIVDNNEATKSIDLMNKIPAIWVEYTSQLREMTPRRININAAYHIDLMDVFGTSNKEIAKMARMLNAGGFWRTANDFIADAALIGQGEKATEMILKAQKSIEELDSIIPALGLKTLMDSPKLKKELEIRSAKTIKP